MSSSCPVAAAFLAAWVASRALLAAAPPASAAPAGSRPATAAKSDLSFCQPPFVNPRIIADLLAWESDGGDQVVAINLTEANDSNRYDAAIQTSTGKFTPKHPMVTSTVTLNEGEQKYDDTIGYQYIGTTTSGVYVLNTWTHGAGTMVANSLLFLTVEEDHGLVEVPESTGGGLGERDGVLRLTRARILVRKLGELALGDRWDGDLRVEGNRILVGRDQGHFSNGSVGPTSPYNNRDIVLKLEDSRQRPRILRGCP